MDKAGHPYLDNFYVNVVLWASRGIVRWLNDLCEAPGRAAVSLGRATYTTKLRRSECRKLAVTGAYNIEMAYRGAIARHNVLFGVLRNHH